MATLLRHGARRIGGSVLQRTQAAVTSPAAAEERSRLAPRRMATDAVSLVRHHNIISHVRWTGGVYLATAYVASRQ